MAIAADTVTKLLAAQRTADEAAESLLGAPLVQPEEVLSPEEQLVHQQYLAAQGEKHLAEHTVPAVQEGDTVLSWGRDGSRCANFRSGGTSFNAPIYCGKVYVAVARQSDGVLTWRLQNTFGAKISSTKGCPSSVVQSVLARAKETGERVGYAAHGTPCNA